MWKRVVGEKVRREMALFAGARLTSVALTLSADSEVPEVPDAGIVLILEFLAHVFLALLLIR